MALLMAMLSRIEHSSTTLLAVSKPSNNSENSFVLFQVNVPDHYTNVCLRVDINMRGIDNFQKKLNA